MSESTTTTSLGKDALDTPLVIFGAGNVTPKANHARFALGYGFAGGWILGIMRGKSAPDSNMLGIAR